MEEVLKIYGPWSLPIIIVVWIITHVIAEPGNPVSILGISYTKPTKPLGIIAYIIRIINFVRAHLFVKAKTKEKSSEADNSYKEPAYVNNTPNWLVKLRSNLKTPRYIARLNQLKLTCMSTMALGAFSAYHGYGLPGEEFELGMALFLFSLLTSFGAFTINRLHR
tara:strand:- start:2229 stop:2723 length:495 start_codon:yes stop_codon:yes gene_type:complete